ncbi:helix-turn-helix transcriptional regulator [Pasteurellaceae bacterium HPA106]|uniref:helix-turn-helix domain-containing protein n=1 Tax=Spirabiliibacterium pneumoniae TaxID=221400 RepID=UPI001AACE80A|nr:AraC family transcriptional regulator [Spirabiliibacterium pneumoniae]MBE2896155.1 helix-turn-helix transcriptional regulator [Spirabiliibacterium pneumoniae]
MDYLDNLIQLADVRGEINVLCRFCGEWQLRHETQPRGVFHIITLGQCRVQIGKQTHQLQKGDILFFPNGLCHLLGTSTQSAVNNALKPRSHGVFELHQSSEEYDFEMFCGYFDYTQSALLPKVMPDYWILSGQETVTMPIVMILQQEAKAQLGSHAIINGLCHVLLTYLIRDYIHRGDALGHSIFAALQDKRLFHAVDAMLKHPEKPWNMVTLAELCAMSRANFIRLFKQKTNTLPGKFLLDLRMQKAQMLLKNSNKSVLNIALEAGYQSESHFSKVFKTHAGVSPSRYRAQTKDS